MQFLATPGPDDARIGCTGKQLFLLQSLKKAVLDVRITVIRLFGFWKNRYGPCAMGDSVYLQGAIDAARPTIFAVSHVHR
jgi:hypothetical protein